MRHKDLVPYHYTARRLIELFRDIRIEHVPRKENAVADALANLATALAVSGGQTITISVEERCMIPMLYEEQED